MAYTLPRLMPLIKYDKKLIGHLFFPFLNKTKCAAHIFFRYDTTGGCNATPCRVCYVNYSFGISYFVSKASYRLLLQIPCFPYFVRHHANCSVLRTPAILQIFGYRSTSFCFYPHIWAGHETFRSLLCKHIVILGL